MINQSKELINKHINSHSVRADEDRSAIAVLEMFLRSKGKINTSFAKNDTWPNHDGTFEFVADPSRSKKPNQNFIVQIKGTRIYMEKDGFIKYSLKSLAFPAFISKDVSLDPGILFVVLNPTCRGSERVFWKYMSVDFLNTIKFNQDSMTICFSTDDEIFNTEESVNEFCEKLEQIAAHHSFVNQLDSRHYSKKDVVRIILNCNKEITESIDNLYILNATRDNVSQRILTRLDDLCSATLLLEALSEGYQNASLQLAWERSMLNIKTKYFGYFLKGLRYIGRRIPDEGQSERLLQKYFNFLWQIREYLYKKFGLRILENLDKFPLHADKLDKQYYDLIGQAIEGVDLTPKALHMTRYYVYKKNTFYIDSERYYEITLQLAGAYASKYNRITAYTKENISTNYSIQIGYVNTSINLWGVKSKIKVITNWRVSIAPVCLNKLGEILKCPIRLTSQYGEYLQLMTFLTVTGINFLDLIDLQEIDFSSIIESIYSCSNTQFFKDILIKLRESYSFDSNLVGRNVVRYLLLNLHEEVLEKVMPSKFNRRLLCDDLNISIRCLPFEKNPYISNLAGSKTNSNGQIKYLISVVGADKIDIVRPYLAIKNAIRQTGEIYFEATGDTSEELVQNYNNHLDTWECQQGYKINLEKGIVCIDSYEKNTLYILRELLKFASMGNKGQEAYNTKFLEQSAMNFADTLKKQAIQNAFVNSRVLLIYGAAGTGKTTLINYLSNLMSSRRKLFLAKTHTALQNLKRRIENPGSFCDFISIDSFTKTENSPKHDIIFVDECSTIDNLTMATFLSKVNSDTFLVLAGDIHQIESIDFGNWFFYAKDIIKTAGASIELLNTWRTNNSSLISLWTEVRTRGPLITEKLVIDGPFSENIGSNVLNRTFSDEVILCLNYDGKFGLNNMNNYFQSANPNGIAVSWDEWSYKVGDPILFNDSKRFPLLYNNLKGRIVNIESSKHQISFTIDIELSLTEVDCKKSEIDFIKTVPNGTRIRITMYEKEGDENEEDKSQMKSIIPFHLAYAVSIHKSQGLEYDSVKVIIPNSNIERITHGIFYTAITRAKKKLKIYWSSETMQDVVKGFSIEEVKYRSLNIVKNKLIGE